MKRRDFLTTTAGLGAAGVLLGKTTSAWAKEKPADEKRLQVYLCEICGTVAEILVPGEAPIVHCGKPMKLLEEKTEGPGAEKHVPVIEKIDGGYKVKVGKVPHPMTEAHHIGFIDLIADGKVCRQFLKPGDKPEAAFLSTAKSVTARAWCNLHGLWKATS
jgi:superoxide reductase